jgi:hypothetical protein
VEVLPYNNPASNTLQVKVLPWEPPVYSPSSFADPVYINDTFSIRSDEDKFGRKITDTRKLYTDNDTKPFSIS